jgi:diguanylate cyclase (GGDEF)-like protein
MFITGRQFKRLRKSRAALRQRNEELMEMSNSLVSSQTSLADLTDELETTLETMEQGLMMVDGQGHVVQCNGRARRMLDLPDALIETRPTFESVLDYQWNTNLSGREDGTFGEFARKRLIVDRPHTQEIKRPDGRIVEVRSMPMAAGGFVRTYSDITERKAAEDKVHYLAHHDNLTRRVNRVVFHERLEQALAMARTSRRGTAVLYLDLDHFKAVNDTRGHAVGDRVLAEAAQRMRASVRAVDTVARFGGDEFAIILPFLESRETAGHLAERLTSSLAQPYVIENIPSCIGVSIGIAIFPDDGLSADELVRHADAALYEAKHAGRSTFRFHAVAAKLVGASA